MSLNPQQHSAATCTDPRALVLAGAGSGKTRVLVERIAHLLDTGSAPSEILAFTFTRQAASEMKARLFQRVGAKAFGVYLGTMHGLGLRLLRQYGEVLGIRPSALTIYNEWETDMLLREVAAELGVLRKKAWSPSKKDVTSTFARCEQTGIEPDDTEPCAAIFKAFHRRCKEHNALPYSGLIHGLRLLVEGGHIGSNQNWRHVLVDEVQDIDTLQWTIIEGICETCGAALFAVGDISQSVYGFRGARPDYLETHAESFAVYRLETNYRSHESIVVAANNLITHNPTKLPLVMRPHWRETPWSGLPSVQVIGDLDSAGIAAQVKRFVAALKFANIENPAGNLVVLARNHGLLSKLESELKALGVTCKRIGKATTLMRSGAFRETIAPLKLVVNRHDNFSFMLLRHRLEVDDEAYRGIRLSAASGGISHMEAWMRSNGTAQAQAWTTLDGTAKMSEAWPTCRDFTVCDGNSEWSEEETLEHRTDLFIDEWITKHPAATVCEFLDWLALSDVQDEMGENKDREEVTLMTIHAAKGLEFPFVIVAACNEEILPSKQALKEFGGVEEERRLAYVAWTRAKSLLVLTVRPEEKIETLPSGTVRVTVNPKSRFISESGL